MSNDGRGWHRESRRHALARRGITTAVNHGTTIMPPLESERVHRPNILYDANKVLLVTPPPGWRRLESLGTIDDVVKSFNEDHSGVLVEWYQYSITEEHGCGHESVFIWKNNYVNDPVYEVNHMKPIVLVEDVGLEPNEIYLIDSDKKFDHIDDETMRRFAETMHKASGGRKIRKGDIQCDESWENHPNIQFDNLDDAIERER